MSKNKKAAKFKAGFSIVEMLVVVAIMTIMTAMVFSLNSKSGPVQDVEAASQQITAELRSLQGEALSGKRIETSPGVFSNVCRVGFYANKGDGFYSVEYFDCGSPSKIIGSARQFNLKNAVFDNAIANNNSVIFVAPLGNAISTFPSNEIVVISTKGGGNAKMKVSIGSNGDIETASL